MNDSFSVYTVKTVLVRYQAHCDAWRWGSLAVLIPTANAEEYSRSSTEQTAMISSTLYFATKLVCLIKNSVIVHALLN